MSEQDLREFFASAVKLDAEDIPRVVAHGSGPQAKKIAAKARQHNIPVLQDIALSKRLSTISLGGEIPKALYVTIAELFAYLSTIEKIVGKKPPIKNDHGTH